MKASRNERKESASTVNRCQASGLTVHQPYMFSIPPPIGGETANISIMEERDQSAKRAYRALRRARRGSASHRGPATRRNGTLFLNVPHDHRYRQRVPDPTPPAPVMGVPSAASRPGTAGP